MEEQFRRRVLLIGRHDYWPGYTPEVIRALPFEYWPHLALHCDEITRQREEDAREMKRRSRGR